jgi:replicative DNA helicase
MPKNDLSIDLCFVLLTLRDIGPEALIGLDRWNLKVEYLSHQAQEAYRYVKEYYEKHGEAPGYELVIHEAGWPKIGYSDLPDMVPDEAAKNILQRVKHNFVNKAQNQIDKVFSNNPQDPEKAIDELVKQAEEARRIGSSGSAKVRESFGLYPKVLDQYNEEEDREIKGYKTPWPTITEALRGYQPGHVIYFCARPGTGKTWSLILNGIKLYEQGLDVLFVSPEMSQLEIVSRQFCVHSEVSYHDFTNNQLTHWSKEKVEEFVEEWKDEKGYLILEDDMSYRKEDVESAIYRYDPDVIIADSFYKFGNGYDEQDRIRQATDWLWKVSRTLGRDRIVLTAAQMNRGAEDQQPESMIKSMIKLHVVICATLSPNSL